MPVYNLAEHKIAQGEKPGPRWGFSCSCGEERYGPYPHKVPEWIKEHLRAAMAGPCAACSGKGYTARSVLHPTNPNYDSWARDFCTVCRGTGVI